MRCKPAIKRNTIRQKDPQSQFHIPPRMHHSTHDTDDTSLAGDMLRGPRKVARFETQGTELLVATAGTDSVDALGSKLGKSGLATELELSLFAVVCALCARCGSLVPRGTSDTCDLTESNRGK